MSWISQFLGMDAANNASKATEQANALQQQLLDLINTYGTPQMKMQLQTLQGMQGPVMAAQGTLSGLMSNPNTFATPDWTQPFTPQEKATLMQLGSMNTNDMTSKLGQAQQTNLNQRGIGNSSAGNALAPNLELFRQSELAKNSANLLNAELTRGDALRAEGKNTAGTLWGLGNNVVPGGQTSQYTGVLSDIMKQLTDQASQYSQSAASQQQQAGGILDWLWSKSGWKL